MLWPLRLYIDFWRTVAGAAADAVFGPVDQRMAEYQSRTTRDPS